MQGLTPAEIRKLRALRDPARLQQYIEDMPYHHAGSAWSPRRVLAEGTAHCLEGAVFAAAALRVNGFPPLLLDLEAVQDTDHVLAVFKIGSGWGAIAKSNFAGLRYREPVYRTVRELAMSYFDDYFNLRGERTLRAVSEPLNLRIFDRRKWMTTTEPLWFIAEHLATVPHNRLITPAQIQRLSRVDRRKYQAGLQGYLAP